jgi:hypothetical protein
VRHEGLRRRAPGGASTPWLVGARPHRRGGRHPGQPGHPRVGRHAARGARRRPVRHRARGAAGRRAGRPSCRPPASWCSARAPTAPARGLQGLDEGGARRRRRAHRPLRHLHRGRSRHSRSSTRCAGPTSSRPTAWPPARACSSPTTSPRPRPTSPAYLSGEAFGDAGRTVVIEEGMTGPELSSSPCATAPGPWPSPRRRTSSGSATATPAPTPAAWAPTRRCPRPPDALVVDVMDRFVEPTLAELRAGASTTGACSTPG